MRACVCVFTWRIVTALARAHPCPMMPADPYYMRRRRRRELSGQQMSFVEAVFSFVFGDGDPNWAYEERKWQQVSKESLCVRQTPGRARLGHQPACAVTQAAAAVAGQL